jgi:hypothetical protein
MDWGSIINGVVGAYGAYQNAQQANKPQDRYTNQTTTQTPYGQGLIDPGVEGVYNYATNLMAQGPRYIGGGSSAPTGGGGGGGRRRGGGGGVGGARGPAGQSDITQLSNQIAQRGLQAGNDPTTRAAQQGVQNILSGQGGADSGGTGYQGFNPILDNLAQNLGGKLDNQNAANQIENFLGGAYGGSNANGSGGGSYGVTPTDFTGYYRSNGMGGTVGGSGGGLEPDSTVPSGLFNDKVKQLLDSKTNAADLQTLIDAQNADITKGMNQANWDLDAQAQGTGRFGGDMWKGLANDARTNAVRQMANASASTRLQDQAQRQSMYENLLGQVNTRDIAAMNDATNRYGISTSAAASGASAAANAAATKRAQDLQALGMLMQNEQYNQGQYGDIGNSLSQDQLGAIGQSQGLAGIGLSGLGQANSAVGNLVGQLGAQNSLRAAQISGGNARAALNQQAAMYNSELPWNNVNNYMGLLRGIGGMGGSTTVQGQNVVPGAGVNPYAAAAMGGYAGYTNAGGGF